MSRRIWKWTIPPLDRFTEPMPDGARVVAVQVQDDQPRFWAEVDDEQPMTDATFFVVGTGGPIPDQAQDHVGTWQSGPFVWHLYRDRPASPRSTIAYLRGQS